MTRLMIILYKRIVLSFFLTFIIKGVKNYLKTLIKIIKEHIEYRQQIFKLAKADIVKTYRGSALGWSWAVIKPTVTIFVYWFAFEIGMKSGKAVNEFPYFLWLITGLIPWFYMGDMIAQGVESIRKYSYLVTKMKFPVSTIPTFFSISKLIINLVLIAIMMVIFMIMGHSPTIYWLQIPFYILCMFLFFTFWGLFAALLGAISKDFANLVKSFVTAVLWLSGIFWNPETIGIGWLKNILMFNPVTFLTNGFRNCFINNIWFFEQPKRLLYFVIVTAIMLLLALWAYRKLKKEIPDVL